MHKLLARQLARYFGSAEAVPADLAPFIQAVDESYQQADADRSLLEHSIDTVSQEMVERFHLLQGALAESKRAEAELTTALSVLEATLESTTDGILVVDAEGRIVRTNRKFLDLWRIPDEVAASGNDDAALSFVLDQLEDPHGFLIRVRDLYANLESESFDVLRFKDQRVFERYSKPQVVGGETVGRVWSFRDVTQRLHLEEQLRQSQKMEAVGSLAGGIAHDFNNILMVIMGHAEFLLNDLGRTRADLAEVDQILKAAARAAGLTRQLLAFSRKQILQPVVLDLNDVITGLEVMLRRLIGEDIRIVTTLAPGLDPVIADRGQLEQVLVNLAVNGRDAMPRGGQLMIETKGVWLDGDSEHVRAGHAPSGRYVALTVRDTGQGIPRAIRDRIFEPFFTTKEAGKGTGLGLATVYGIVQQSGGHIFLESEEEVGTTFWILLPAREVPAIETAPRERSPATGNETILVVEDENSVRDFVRRALESLGYSVICVSSGSAALTTVLESGRVIDLLLTDVVMPEISGRELVEHLRVHQPGLRVLYMSGYTDDEILRRGVLQPDTSFLQKPFTLDDLALAVRYALGSTANGAASRPEHPEIAARAGFGSLAQADELEARRD